MVNSANDEAGGVFFLFWITRNKREVCSNIAELA